MHYTYGLLDGEDLAQHPVSTTQRRRRAAAGAAATASQGAGAMDHVEEADALAVVRDDEDNVISPGAMDPKNWRLHGPVNREGGSSQPPVRHIPLPLPLPASDTDGRYQCTKCPRKFPTPQSLGGHMSFHVKAKRVAERSAWRPRPLTTSWRRWPQPRLIST
ncbi:hypothetical protein D1007_48399 [Hordeum vulgare]|nr:hypothetical protein D1007_48399 [Hordeum vulgare]